MKTILFSRRKVILLALVLGAGCACFYGINYRQNSAKSAAAEDQSIGQLVASEKVILLLQRKLNRLSHSAMNLRLPDWQTTDLFESKVQVRDLTDKPRDSTSLSGSLGLKQLVWPVSATPQSTLDSKQLRLLRPLFESVAYLKQFKFKLVKGRYKDSSKKTFVAEVSMSGLALTREARMKRSFHGNAIVHWELQDAALGDETIWAISDWLQQDLAVVDHSASFMFRDAIGAVIPSAWERTQGRRSIQEELVIEMVKKGQANLPGPKYKHDFDFVSSGFHPGLAVVDIDGNGWDDLYVMSRWGKNQLYRNQGDGTFREVAREYGLDIEAHCTSAVFADFDNDGDPDLFLGRSALHSLYLVNENGKFIDRSASLVKAELPGMVSSISAADYNQDGLLDVYFSVYGHKESLAKELLPASKFREFAERVNSNNARIYIDGVGVPNLLLTNQGQGRFARAPEAKQLEFWQTTLQSTWADFDQDGDPDLYVCNDFGPDRLMRNDHPKGFTEVTQQQGHETMTGFGMGASWGDYDLDGQQDLYVSNMFSKAGMRITERIDELDPRFQSFASGNRLYRQTKAGFQYTSGLKAPKMLVAKAGWSWGGQFADFDNDGYLDIYVTSGYFTAPAEVAAQDDL